MNIPSDPVINFYDPVVSYSFCGGKGHTKVSCHYAKAKSASGMSYDDLIFWSFVHPDDRPTCVKDLDFGDYSESESEDESDSDSDDSN